MAICVVALALWLPVSAYAAVLSFDYIQHRKYENGSEFNVILFSLKDQSGNFITDNIVKSIEVSDPDGITVESLNISHPFEKALYGHYDAQNSKWIYDNTFSSEGYYYVHFTQTLKSGKYHLKITDNSGIIYLADKIFSGSTVTLPIISSKSFYAYRDNLGNMIWTWNVPNISTSDSSLNTSVRAIIEIYNNDNYIGYLNFQVPTHLGYLFVPNNVYQKILAEGNVFKLLIQFRTNDNQNRSYSNSLRTEDAASPQNCVSVADNLNLNISCAEYKGNRYGFILNYSPVANDPYYWRMDPNTFMNK